MTSVRIRAMSTFWHGTGNKQDHQDFDSQSAVENQSNGAVVNKLSIQRSHCCEGTNLPTHLHLLNQNILLKM